MSREKSLFKNTMIITIGKICTQLITFLLLPLYTSVLSTSEYGIVDLLNTLVSLLLPIVTFQIEQAVFRELIEYRKDNNKKEEIISTAVITVFLQCFLYSIICFMISPFIHNHYKFFLITNVITYIFLSLFQQIARGIGDNRRYAFGSFLSAFCTIVFNIILLVYIPLGANGMLLGTMLGQIVAIIYLFIALKLYMYIQVKKYKNVLLFKLWKYSFHLIPNAISWWVFNASDRLIVSSVLGINENGILAASLKFSMIIIALYNIFNMSWTESISLSIHDTDIEQYFNKMFHIMLKLFVSICFVMISFIPFIYPILIDEKFYQGYYLIPISIMASLFHVVVGLVSVIYVGKKDTKAIANTSVIAALINALIHLLLIKFIGLYASVISTFFAFFIMSIYRYIDVKKRYLDIHLNKSLILSGTIICLLIIYCYYMNYMVSNIISLFVTIIYAWYLNRHEMARIVNLLKKKVGKEV